MNQRDEARARLGLPPLTVVEPENTTPEDVIPEVLPMRERTPEDMALDTALGNLDIIDAYTRWCGKMTPDPTGKRESIMCSCPKPEHPDTHPSAWINLDKQVYHCGACSEGGNKYNIAGMHFGLDPQTQFIELRRAMGVDMGIIVKAPSGKHLVIDIDAPDPDVAVDPDLAPVIQMPQFVPEAPIVSLGIDWEKMFPAGTYIHEYVKAMDATDVPTEFAVANAIQAVSLAMGRSVTLVDDYPKVIAPLFMCLLGDSGSGKSKSLRPTQEIIREALPYDHNDFANKGVRTISQPGSAEALIDAFTKIEYDDVDPKIIIERHPVNGWLIYPELSLLVGLANRTGNTLKPILQDFYDGGSEVSTSSRAHGISIAAYPYCCVTTTTQPQLIGKLMTQADADSGFMNRILMWAATAKQRHSRGGQQVDVGPLITLLKAVHGWAVYGRDLTFDDDANKVWDYWFQNEFEPLMHEDQPMLNRMDLNFKRIISVMASNEKRIIVPGDLVERALLLWPYFKNTYIQLGLKLGMTESYEISQAVIAALRDYHAVNVLPSVRDLVNRKLSKRFKNMETVRRALDTMVALGQIEEVAQKGKGRPTIRYRLLGEDEV